MTTPENTIAPVKRCLRPTDFSHLPAATKQRPRALLTHLLDRQGITQPIIALIFADGGCAALINRCPHARWPLDRFDGTFLFNEAGHLLCAAHGALFMPKDGTCLGGPGLGQPLTSVPMTATDDGWWIGPL